MVAFVLCLFRFLRVLGGGHQAIRFGEFGSPAATGDLQAHKRPRLTTRDRWFWILLTHVWKDWRTALVVVQPDTVVRWHRERFRRFWLSCRKAVYDHVA